MADYFNLSEPLNIEMANRMYRSVLSKPFESV